MTSSEMVNMTSADIHKLSITSDNPGTLNEDLQIGQTGRRPYRLVQLNELNKMGTHYEI